MGQVFRFLRLALIVFLVVSGSKTAEGALASSYMTLQAPVDMGSEVAAAPAPDTLSPSGTSESAEMPPAAETTAVPEPTPLSTAAETPVPDPTLTPDPDLFCAAAAVDGTEDFFPSDANYLTLYSMAVAQWTTANGGATYSFALGNMAGKRFYAVSVAGREKKYRSAPSAEQIRQYMEDNKDLLKSSKYSMGTWYDTKEETLYLDVSLLIAQTEVPLIDYALAYCLAVANKQQGFFDLFNMKAIEIPQK